MISKTMQTILHALSYGNIEVEASRRLADIKKLDAMRIFVKKLDTKVYNGAYEVPVRLYFPSEEAMSGEPVDGEKYPVLLFFHGGGWVTESVENYDRVCSRMAQSTGHIVMSVEYRLAPENRFPKGVEDAYDTAKWAYEHAAEFGGDPNTISVCGDSAGGNFAAAVSLMARDKKESFIKKQFLIYPATAFNLGYRSTSEKRYGNGEYFLKINSEEEGLNYYFEDPADADSPYASPLYVDDLRNLPPACFISAECDPLLDQALMYAAKLEDAGVSVEYHLYKGMVHAFINRPLHKTFEAFNTIIEAMPKTE